MNQKIAVRELGERALDLVDQFSVGWDIYLRPESLERIVFYFRDIFGLGTKRGLYRENFFQASDLSTRVGSELLGENTGDSNILLNVWRNDILPIKLIIDSFADGFKEFEAKFTTLSARSQIDQLTINSISSYLIYLTVFRNFCMTLAYVNSNGDPKFVSTIPSKQLPYLLLPALNKRPLDGDIGIECELYTPDFVGLYEFIKVAEGDMNISTSNRADHFAFKVRGTKTVVDDTAKPMELSNIQNIFNGNIKDMVIVCS